MTEASSPHSGKGRVLLIGWDAADWQHIDPLIEVGLMPTLEGMINEGVMGNLATLQPVLSPMLWNSIATGKLADAHGIYGFMEPDPVNGGARPSTGTSRKVKALWNILHQRGMRSNVVSWWASHPVEPINGHVVSNFFNHIAQATEGRGLKIPPHAIHPPDKAAKLGRFKIHPGELTQEHILPFIPRAAEIDQEKDGRLRGFVKQLSDCASTQAVATTLMEEEEWDFTAVYFEAVDHFCHLFMDYHPPMMPKVREKDFEIFKDCIRGIYRFHDMMLERLLQLAGPEATVILCSDHGFQSAHMRPGGTPREPAGPAAWHRDIGMIVMKGPGIKKDERIYGAGLLDIAPTILKVFKLPVGEDMNGRALLSAFENPEPPQTIPSWEELEGDCGMHPPGTELGCEQSAELTKQFVALGYVEDHGDNKEKAEESARTEQDYNLARVFLSTRRPEKARELMEALVHRYPWESRFLSTLATCYYEAGYFRQTRKLLDRTYPPGDPTPPMMVLLRGRTLLRLGDVDGALTLFQAAVRVNPRLPNLHVELGKTFINLNCLDDAEAAFDKAIKIDPDCAQAHQGLAALHLRRQENEEAAESALQAVGLLYQLPKAHFSLGIALARLGWGARAIQAFETALKMRPGMINGHRWLSALYGQEMDNQIMADFHREKFRAARNRSKAEAGARAELASQKFDLPEIPSTMERWARTRKERPSSAELEAQRGKSGRTFTLVSGLPRSGTSLMMQLLDAGGISPRTDGERVADEDNPEGYYEWEAVKQLSQQPEVLDEEGLEGKAIKVISMLLSDLPIEHKYQVIFMTRPMEEVAASQKKMIDRLGNKGMDEKSAGGVERRLNQHRRQVFHSLESQSNIEWITVEFPDLVSDPQPQLDRVVDFLGAERLPHVREMSSVVRPELHRQKADRELQS